MIEKAVYDDFWFVKVPAGYDTSEGVRLWESMMIWCRDTLEGNDGTLRHARKYAWTCERFPKYTSFAFDRESDAIMFALRWA
jgi:hypothetical protein